MRIQRQIQMPIQMQIQTGKPLSKSQTSWQIPWQISSQILWQIPCRTPWQIPKEGFLRWVLGGTPASGPMLIYYDGYYPLANSISVRPSAYDGPHLCSIAEQWCVWNADVQASEMRCKGFRLAACGIWWAVWGKCAGSRCDVMSCDAL